MNSFISWVGGKKQLRNKILEQFPDANEYDRYIEVFGGAGWVLFAKEKHAKMEIFNDANGELINLYRCVKYHSEALRKELEWNLTSRELYFDYKEQIQVRGLTDIQRAARYFIMIKNSFGNTLQSFGIRGHNLDNAIRYLGIVKERLKNTVIENRDFENLIKVCDRKKALFYLDPPYFGTESYYNVNFNQEDHIRLKDILYGIKGKFILSYNDSDFIKNLYKGFNIIEIDRQNNLSHNQTGTRYKELIIKNY